MSSRSETFEQLGNNEAMSPKEARTAVASFIKSVEDGQQGEPPESIRQLIADWEEEKSRGNDTAAEMTELSIANNVRQFFLMELEESNRTGQSIDIVEGEQTQLEENVTTWESICNAIKMDLESRDKGNQQI